MFKRGQYGWWICGVPEHRMSSLLTQGWSLVVCDAQVREQDIEDTYWADLKERR
jgi:hypothetical protein